MLSHTNNTVSVADATRAATARRRSWSRYSSRTFYLFISPWLVLGFIALTVMPLAYGLGVSFTNYDGMSPRWHWIGLSNYSELFGDPDTWWSLGRTLLYMGITVPLGVIGGLALALLLNQKIRNVGFFRTIFYVPAVVPVVATAVMWKIMFDRDAGIINAIYEALGGSAITWLVDPTAFTALIVMVLWGLGGGMVIFLAGLQGVPTELREAAAVDGANPFQAFRAVTLPLLTPVIFFQVVTGVIYSLQTLVQPLLLAVSSGAVGPDSVPRSNYLYMVNVYAQVFSNGRLGYGAALLWVLFAVILALTLIVFRSSTLWVYYEVEPGKAG
jgi:multiple sugar transport system permease protein